ncbi:MAG: bacteriohemerythrin [Sulfuricurvum sp.]
MLPDNLRVGIDAIDRRHEEFYELYDALKGVKADEFVQRFAEVIEHTRNHFAEEEGDMETLAYPNDAEHRAEHAKALEEMEYFYEKAKSGRGLFARAYVNDRLGDWFRNHLLNMDSDLARVMKLRG